MHLTCTSSAGNFKLTSPGAQFEGDLGEILALGPKFCPILVSGRSGSLPEFFFS